MQLRTIDVVKSYKCHTTNYKVFLHREMNVGECKYHVATKRHKDAFTKIVYTADTYDKALKFFTDLLT